MNTELKRDPYAAFRHRDFCLYSMAFLAVWVGVQVQSVAIGYELYDRTNEPLALGMVALMQALPAIGLALPAGYLADRFDRRRLIRIAMTGTTITSLILAYLSWIKGPIPLMYAVLFLDASFIAVGRPARSAMMPSLVPRIDFPNAVTWHTSMFQAAMFVGPAAGGFVVAWTPVAAYVISAACTTLCLVAIGFLRTPYAPPMVNRTPPNWSSLMAGVKFLYDSKVLLAAVTLDMFAVLLGGAVYLMPIYAKDILKVGPTGLGFLNAAPAVGAIVMAFAIAHMPPMQKAGRNLLWSVVGFGVATIVFGVSENFILSLAMLVLVGAFDAVSVVIRHTLAQLLTPDSMRGRLSAVNAVFISTSNQIGGVESGLAAQWLGPVWAVVTGGIGTIVVVGIIAMVSSGLVRFGALHEAGDPDAKLCGSCGYDLRGTIEAGRTHCPECGAPVPTPLQPSAQPA